MKKVLLLNTLVCLVLMVTHLSCTPNKTYRMDNSSSKTRVDNKVVMVDNATNNSASSKMKTYSNNLYSVSYPSDWFCAEHPNDFIDVAFGQEVGIAFSIFHVDIADPLKVLVDDYNVNMKTQMDATIVSNKKIKLCNVDCYKTVFTFVLNNGLKDKLISYTLKKGSIGYTIKFNGSVSSIDKNAQLIETIIASFKLKS